MLQEAVLARPSRRTLPWVVLAILPARLVFSFLAQGLTAGVLWLTGSTTPWQDAAGWWTVYGTVTDILCLIVLAVALRAEGRRLRDLFALNGTTVRSQLAWTPVYLAALAPFVAASSLITQPFYGAGVPPQVSVIELPPVAGAFSLVVWPVLWAITEQLVYLRYLLPRLEVLTGSRLLAASLVVLFWAAQHLALPFLLDGTYLLSRFLGALFVCAGMTLVYLLLKRRYLPAMVAHWLSDASTVALAVFVVGS